MDTKGGEANGVNEDDVGIEELRGKAVCTCHIWMLSRGNQVCNRTERPVHLNGITSLECIPERRIVTWVRKKIFSEDKLVWGNILFCYSVYEHYKELCEMSGRKLQTEKYVIGRLAGVLSMFHIFMKRGKELSQGKAFF